ncbi:MAG TPA: hypothetical protein ENG87_00735 [Candidatus Pacearchaeota archaeon]|nr:hypothetical protein [Candidatus Pacearchaeota archaeon]
MIRINDVVFYKKSNDFRSVVLGDLLNLLVNKGVIELSNIKNKANKIALTDTLDTESDKIINTIIKGDINKLKNSRVVNNNILKPLYLFLDREVELYARLKGLKFSAKKTKKNKISLFIDDMEKNHPELKRAIVNSYLELC